MTEEWKERRFLRLREEKIRDHGVNRNCKYHGQASWLNPGGNGHEERDLLGERGFKLVILNPTSALCTDPSASKLGEARALSFMIQLSRHLRAASLGISNTPLYCNGSLTCLSHPPDWERAETDFVFVILAYLDLRRQGT